MTTADAVYTQPSIPVANTAGHDDAWTGAYVQIRAAYAFAPNLTGTLEALHDNVGSTIQHAGGRDGNYLGAELKFSCDRISSCAKIGSAEADALSRSSRI